MWSIHAIYVLKIVSASNKFIQLSNGFIQNTAKQQKLDTL